MAWLYVPGLGGSNWDSNLPWASHIELSVTSSGKPLLRPYSWRGWKTRPWIKLLSGTISRPSMAERGVASWISSLRDSRVSRSASQGSDEASKTSDGSGPTSSESSGTWVQGSFFSRTCRDSCITDCESCGVTFGAWVSQFGQASSRRQKSGRHTGDRGSSSWPTATASSGTAGYSTESGRHSGTTLTDAIRLYPTPAAQTYGTNQGGAAGRVGPARPSLETWARTYPTPAASNADRGPSGDVEEGRYRHGRRLQDQAYGHGVLNPRFVEWLMGLPIGWTSFEPLGTEWSRWWRLMRGEL